MNKSQSYSETRLYPENRVKVAERIRRELCETFEDKFIQENVLVDNNELQIIYKSKLFRITVFIEKL